jgi:hypothetical protein
MKKKMVKDHGDLKAGPLTAGKKCPEDPGTYMEPLCPREKSGGTAINESHVRAQD